LLNKNIKIIFNYVLGPLVFLFLFYSIYEQILKQPDWQQSLHQISGAIQGPHLWKIFLVLLLMFLNWGLETKKWQLALRTLEPVPFTRAFKAVLTGVTIGSFTPNRMGEYLGRMLYIEESKRVRSISLTLICSMAQLLTTLAGGFVGILFLSHYLNQHAFADQAVFKNGLHYLLFGTVVACFFGLLFYFRLSSLVRIFDRDYFKKFRPIVKVLQEVKTSILLQILFLSFGRYLVFLVQYFLLFSVFAVELTGGQAFAGISVMFLIIAIVPSFTFLTDLGLRWETSIRVIELFSPNSTGILAVSLGIWLINLIIPALIGSLLILRIKLFRNR
jgi:Lysylphosphatidylglycerol synthase TM region